MEKDIIEVPYTWEIPFKYTAGEVLTKFFYELKEKRIMGIRCPKCKRVLLPPRGFCEMCFEPLEEWVEVSDEGVIGAFQICCMKFLGAPEPPWASGLIRLDGADTAILHFIGGIDLSDIEKGKEAIKIGTRVKAVWSDAPKGLITDIRYFTPV